MSGQSSTKPSGLTRLFLGGNTALVLLFLYAPIILLAVYSFSGSRNPG